MIWVDSRSCSSSAHEVTGTMPQLQLRSQSKMFIPLSCTFLRTRKQGWEFWRNRLPTLWVARWTTKRALCGAVWLMNSPGWTPVSSGAWKGRGRMAGKGCVPQKLRNVCGRFFPSTQKSSYKLANQIILWQFCPDTLAFVPQPFALGSEILCVAQEWWVNTFTSVSLFCLLSIYRHL